MSSFRLGIIINSEAKWVCCQIWQQNVCEQHGGDGSLPPCVPGGVTDSQTCAWVNSVHVFMGHRVNA